MSNVLWVSRQSFKLLSYLFVNSKHREVDVYDWKLWYLEYLKAEFHRLLFCYSCFSPHVCHGFYPYILSYFIMPRAQFLGKSIEIQHDIIIIQRGFPFFSQEPGKCSLGSLQIMSRMIFSEPSGWLKSEL